MVKNPGTEIRFIARKRNCTLSEANILCNQVLALFTGEHGPKRGQIAWAVQSSDVNATAEQLAKRIADHRPGTFQLTTRKPATGDVKSQSGTSFVNQPKSSSASITRPQKQQPSSRRDQQPPRETYRPKYVERSTLPSSRFQPSPKQMSRAGSSLKSTQCVHGVRWPAKCAICDPEGFKDSTGRG